MDNIWSGVLCEKDSEMCLPSFSFQGFLTKKDDRKRKKNVAQTELTHYLHWSE